MAKKARPAKKKPVPSKKPVTGKKPVTKKKAAAKRKSPQKPAKLSATALRAGQMSLTALLEPIRTAAAAQQVLGHAAAVTIVCGCANTSPLNLPRTLGELGVNGLSFQTCVFNGVTSAGFQISIDAIPNSSSTTLIAVVNAIEGAPQAA
jgi:hypothetical protein